MIALVNYGLGNISALVNIYKRLNIPVCIADSERELEKASKLVLPGVGAFDWAITRLQESGMRECLDHLVLVEKRPILGICVGMQMMAARSEEGKLKGLNWIDGEVRRFDQAALNQKTKLPHMGWNDVEPLSNSCIFKGIESPRFYFLHSYYLHSASQEIAIGITRYGLPFISAIRSKNIFATQFHPEKSHHWGIQLLKNFGEI